MQGLVDVTDNYKEFKRLRRPALSPIELSASMPSLGRGIDPGMRCFLRFLFFILIKVEIIPSTLVTCSSEFDQSVHIIR